MSGGEALDLSDASADVNYELAFPARTPAWPADAGAPPSPTQQGLLADSFARLDMFSRCASPHRSQLSFRPLCRAGVVSDGQELSPRREVVVNICDEVDPVEVPNHNAAVPSGCGFEPDPERSTEQPTAANESDAGAPAQVPAPILAGEPFTFAVSGFPHLIRTILSRSGPGGLACAAPC